MRLCQAWGIPLTAADFFNGQIFACDSLPLRSIVRLTSKQNSRPRMATARGGR
jgi:hypothetical protein